MGSILGCVAPAAGFFWRSGDQCRIPGCNQPTISFGSVCEGPSIAVAVGGRTEGCSGIDVASRPKSANLSLNRKTAGPFVLAQLRVKAVHEDEVSRLD